MLRDDATLLDMAKAARLAVEFTRGMDRESFLSDVKTQSAVLHQLLVLEPFSQALMRQPGAQGAINRAPTWGDKVILLQTAIGESVKRLSEEFRARNPQISWRSIASLRNVLIHQYDTVDLDQVWRVLERDIPDLIVRLDPLLPSP